MKEALFALRPLVATDDLVNVYYYDNVLARGCWRRRPDWLQAVDARFDAARVLMIPGVAHRIEATIESELLRD